MTVDGSDESRSALVTGAAGGIGRAVCAALCERGIDVIVTDIDGAGAEQLAGQLRDHGGSARAQRLDVTDRDEVEAFIGALPGPDILVNLAGVIKNQMLTKIEDADFQNVLGVHVEGALHTMRAAAVGMKSRGYGRIVNMSSIARNGSIAGGSYGAAKGALEALSRTAALELARHGVTVNCVAPGLVSAGMFLTTPPAYQDELKARIPMGRVADAREIAACVAFLSSAAASYVTGQTLIACGGLSLGF
jgi:3-oxoacyl-[acyl-carrier protein] reductase